MLQLGQPSFIGPHIKEKTHLIERSVKISCSDLTRVHMATQEVTYRDRAQELRGNMSNQDFMPGHSVTSLCYCELYDEVEDGEVQGIEIRQLRTGCQGSHWSIWMVQMKRNLETYSPGSRDSSDDKVIEECFALTPVGLAPGLCQKKCSDT